jgi:DNA repair protein RAD50
MKSDVQKNGKATFKTLDSTIITEDPVTGKKEESGRRVEDVNNEMSASMGVSKAILNNVIFCHQEDSNWPLDEGKKLKEKFDAIFGTTEYNKAIDKILKFRKEYEDKFKACVQEKKFLSEIKRDADRKNLNYDLLVQNHGKMQEKVEELDKRLVPIEDQVTKLLTKERTYGTLIGTKAVYEAT